MKQFLMILLIVIHHILIIILQHITYKPQISIQNKISRKSTLISQTPGYLQNYHCQLASSSKSILFDPNQLIMLRLKMTMHGFPILFHMFFLIITYHILIKLSIYQLFPKLNQNSSTKLSNPLNGVKLRRQNSLLCKPTILGFWPLYLLKRKQLGVSGFTRLILKLMEVWRDIKPVWWPKGILSVKA